MRTNFSFDTKSDNVYFNGYLVTKISFNAPDLYLHPCSVSMIKEYLESLEYDTDKLNYMDWIADCNGFTFIKNGKEYVTYSLNCGSDIFVSKKGYDRIEDPDNDGEEIAIGYYGNRKERIFKFKKLRFVIE